MYKIKKPFIQTLVGHITVESPIWLMRQAGRYLPEYRLLRNQAGSFLGLCLNSKLSSEVTLQPIRRFGFDAAIIFADILLVPYALGQKLEFLEGEGPVLEPVDNEKSLSLFKADMERVGSVFEAIGIVKEKLPASVAQIGFCGGLWSVACYMIEGQGKRGFKKALNVEQYQPEFLEQLIRILHDATFEYVCRQIEAGAEVIQIFDSWAGLLKEEKFRRWVIEPTKNLVRAIEEKYPEIPIIGFPNNATPADYRAYVNETGVDALSIDQHIPLNFARTELQIVKPLQGNLDPELLLIGGSRMKEAVENIINKLGSNHVFNLGHGVLPDTPPENVAALVKMVRDFRVSE
ncbi:MAG: uroporphyrinogen decarboxylase [Alphaproteobacteria bacterium]|nr:uroporphyrinogen decarboxylase [Alphaproteobacteria bacterium]